MEVTQMLLKCTMAVNEAVLPMALAKAGQHAGPERASVLL